MEEGQRTSEGRGKGAEDVREAEGSRRGREGAEVWRGDNWGGRKGRLITTKNCQKYIPLIFKY